TPPPARTPFPYTTLFRSELAARGGRRQERHVARQRPEIAGMVREPLELERDGAKPLRTQRCLLARQRFEHRGIRGGVRDGRVARSEEHTSELQSPDHIVC